MACSVWKVPFFPVMPWQMTLVFLSTKTAGGGDGAAAKWRDCDDRQGFFCCLQSFEAMDPRILVAWLRAMSSLPQID